MFANAGIRDRWRTRCIQGANIAGKTHKGMHGMKLSARNALQGTVMTIQPGAVNAVIKIELPDGQLVTSSISMEALHELDLRVGHKAYAIIKASDVLVGVEE